MKKIIDFEYAKKYPEKFKIFKDLFGKEYIYNEQGTFVLTKEMINLKALNIITNSNSFRLFGWFWEDWMFENKNTNLKMDIE